MVNGVLVTGGAGFIGSHLVDTLMSEGFDDVDACMYAMGRKNRVGEGINVDMDVETSINKLAHVLAELVNLRDVKVSMLDEGW